MPCAPQNLFLLFVQPWASLKIFFYRLPSFGQVSNYFFSVCPALGKSQIIFLTFAQAEQALQFIFRGLLKWNGRGGAYVPARTSAQRRFHTKNTCIVRGDERWMRPCRATRAGTQAPPLPTSIKPLCHATFLHFARRQTVCHQPFHAFVYRQTLRRQPFSMEHHAPEILPT